MGDPDMNTESQHDSPPTPPPGLGLLARHDHISLKGGCTCFTLTGAEQITKCTNAGQPDWNHTAVSTVTEINSGSLTNRQSGSRTAGQEPDPEAESSGWTQMSENSRAKVDG